MNEDEALNLSLISRYDDKCVAILDRSANTHLYEFNRKCRTWLKLEIGGIFFLYKRSIAPFFALFILNRRKPNQNRIEYISKDFQLSQNGNFMLFKCSCHGISSIWFHSIDDFVRIFKRVENILSQYVDNKQIREEIKPLNLSKMPASESNKEDIFDKLELAEAKFKKYFGEDRIKLQDKINSRKKIKNLMDIEDAAICELTPKKNDTQSGLDNITSGEEASSTVKKSSQLEKWIIQSGDDLDDSAIFRKSIDVAAPEVSEIENLPISTEKICLNECADVNKNGLNNGNLVLSNFMSSLDKQKKKSDSSPSDYLSKNQLKLSLIHMINNDEDFIDKLHKSYLGAIEERLSVPATTSQSTPLKNKKNLKKYPEP